MTTLPTHAPLPWRLSSHPRTANQASLCQSQAHASSPGHRYGQCVAANPYAPPSLLDFDPQRLVRSPGAMIRMSRRAGALHGDSCSRPPRSSLRQRFSAGRRISREAIAPRRQDAVALGLTLRQRHEDDLSRSAPAPRPLLLLLCSLHWPLFSTPPNPNERLLSLGV